MNEVKHTPGPWHVGDKPVGNDPIIWAGKLRGCVARVNGDAPGRPKAVSDADARLIASAPDTLAAAKAALAALNQPVQFTGTETAGAANILRADAKFARDVLHAAIAKAEGTAE